LAVAPSTVALGGQLTSGVGIAFTTPGDKVPGTVSTGNVTLGFTAATAIPVGGRITVSLPVDYFLHVNSAFVSSLSSAGFHFYCRCSLTKASGVGTFDAIVCVILSFVCSRCAPSSAVTSVPSSNTSSGLLLTFIAPKQGYYRLRISSAAYTGLAATYYGALCTSTASKHWTFDCPASANVLSGTAAEWTLSNSAGRMGVNLVGFVKPPAKGLYKFYLRTLTGLGSGDMWIGNSRIIAATGLQEASYAFDSVAYYDFQITYSKSNGSSSSSSNVTMQVEWESYKLFRRVIDMNFLYGSVDLGDSGNFSYMVKVV
jgi:hypothetical protein